MWRDFQTSRRNEMASGRGAASAGVETEEQARIRFQVELEFVQCLANPNYLTYLAQRGCMKEQTFVNYIKYLQYWKQPQYAKFIKYPQCLHFLELLQHDSFRKELVNAQCAKFIEDQQLLHWQHYMRRRVKLEREEADHEDRNQTQENPQQSQAVPSSTDKSGS